MATKASKTRKPIKKAGPVKKASSTSRFGESYSSLILGIIVVIVGTVLLLSLVRSRSNVIPRNNESQLSVQTDDSNKNKTTGVPQGSSENISTPSSQVAAKAPSATATPVPTKALPTEKSTSIPTQKPEAGRATPAAQKEQPSTQMVNPGGTYVAQSGDTLWSISEKTYKSGYNWVDIARANKLSNPDYIEKGTKLTLPKVEQKNISSDISLDGKSSSPSASTTQTNRIAGSSYKIKSGDTLWDISVRAYGDGYQWPKLQRANKLSNPDLILSGNSLNIPRK